jgi:protein involved in polysaccharide export with SLBB domain
LGKGEDAKPAVSDKGGAVGAVVGHVFVSGDVLRGGSLDIFAGQTLTLTGAILRAGGIGEWGNPYKVQITRQTPDKQEQKITVNLRKIMKAGDAKLDPVLQDGDRIFVPKTYIGP